MCTVQRVVYSGMVEARTGKFDFRYKLRYFVLTPTELLWYSSARHYFTRPDQPERRLGLRPAFGRPCGNVLVDVEQYPASAKYPALFYLRAGDKSTWELKWPSMEHARPWELSIASLLQPPPPADHAVISPAPEPAAAKQHLPSKPTPPAAPQSTTDTHHAEPGACEEAAPEHHAEPGACEEAATEHQLQAEERLREESKQQARAAMVARVEAKRQARLSMSPTSSPLSEGASPQRLRHSEEVSVLPKQVPSAEPARAIVVQHEEPVFMLPLSPGVEVIDSADSSPAHTPDSASRERSVSMSTVAQEWWEQMQLRRSQDETAIATLHAMNRLAKTEEVTPVRKRQNPSRRNSNASTDSPPVWRPCSPYPKELPGDAAAAAEAQVKWVGGIVEARTGKFDIRYKPRYFVLTPTELLWYSSARHYFTRPDQPERRLGLRPAFGRPCGNVLVDVEQYPASAKYPALFYLRAGDKSTWELKWPSMEHARPWVR